MEEGPEISQNANLNKQAYTKKWIESILSTKIEDDDFNKWIQNGDIVYKVVEYIVNKSNTKFKDIPLLNTNREEKIQTFLNACEKIGINFDRSIDIDNFDDNIDKIIDYLYLLALECNKQSIKPLYVDVNLKESNDSKPVDSDFQFISPRKALPKPPQDPQALSEGIDQVVAKIRGYLNRKKHSERVKFEAVRRKIVNEILETELSYVNHLNMLIEYFYEPLLANTNSQKPMMTKEEFKSIFSSVDIIKSYNQQLLEKIRPRIENWSPTQKIGDIFVEMAGFLKVYTNYVSNYSHAIHTLNECKKRERVRQFFENNEMKERTMLHTFNSLLICPVQRVPRYFNLLSELKKKTWKDHVDYKDIESATEIMENVVNYMNEKTRDAENVAKVAEIQDRIQDSCDLALPHRRFVENFNLKVHMKNKVRMLKMYIFNDIVIIVKAIKQTISLRSKKSKEKIEKMFNINNTNLELTGNIINFKEDSTSNILYSVELVDTRDVENILELYAKVKALSDLFEKNMDPELSNDPSPKKSSWLNPLNLLSTIKDTFKEDDKKHKSKDSESRESNIKRKLRRFASISEKKNKTEIKSNRVLFHTKGKSTHDIGAFKLEDRKKKFSKSKSERNLSSINNEEKNTNE